MRPDEAIFGSGEDDAPDGNAVDTERIARALTYLRLPPLTLIVSRKKC